MSIVLAATGPWPIGASWILMVSSSDPPGATQGPRAYHPSSPSNQAPTIFPPRPRAIVQSHTEMQTSQLHMMPWPETVKFPRRHSCKSKRGKPKSSKFGRLGKIRAYSLHRLRNVEKYYERVFSLIDGSRVLVARWLLTNSGEQNRLATPWRKSVHPQTRPPTTKSYLVLSSNDWQRAHLLVMSPRKIFNTFIR